MNQQTDHSRGKRNCALLNKKKELKRQQAKEEKEQQLRTKREKKEADKKSARRTRDTLYEISQ